MIARLVSGSGCHQPVRYASLPQLRSLPAQLNTRS